MKDLGGIVFRKPRGDAVDGTRAAEIDALGHKWKAMEEEWQAADDDANAAIKEKTHAIKSKIQETGDKIDARMDAIDREFEARLRAIDEQSDKASGGMKATFETSKADTKAEWQDRKTKLAQSVRWMADRIEA